MVKEKLIEKQFVLILNGPSCGGKSTVANILFEKYGGIFNAKSDAIKWFFSDYSPKVYRELVHRVTLEMMRTVLDKGISVMKEGLIYDREEYLKLITDLKIPLFIVNIEAPWELLVSRFERRIQAKSEGAKKISNTDPVRFKELYDLYNDTKVTTDLQFDSSKQSPEEIAETIVSYIKKFQIPKLA